MAHRDSRRLSLNRAFDYISTGSAARARAERWDISRRSATRRTMPSREFAPRRWPSNDRRHTRFTLTSQTIVLGRAPFIAMLALFTITCSHPTVYSRSEEHTSELQSRFGI